MGCPVLPGLLQLQEYIKAEQDRHEEAVNKILKQSEEWEIVDRDCNANLTGRSRRTPLKLKPDKKDFNTFCEAAEDISKAPSTVQQRLLLRAAFQLLAERETAKCRSGQKILLEGTLRKAPKRKVGIGSVSQNTGAWKSKYVQVMEGALVYADMRNNGRLGRAKKLRLYRQKYSCSPLSDVQRDQLLEGKTSTFNEGSSSNPNGTPTRRKQLDHSKLQDLHCFELVDSGGRRRIWCTDSHQECFQWVTAVTRAMVDAPLKRWPQSPIHHHHEQQLRSKSLEFTEDAVTHIPTGPYICDKFRYISIRNGLKSALTIPKYLEELDCLGTGTQVCISS